MRPLPNTHPGEARAGEGWRSQTAGSPAGFPRWKALAFGVMETPEVLTRKEKQEIDPSSPSPHPTILCQSRKQSGASTGFPPHSASPPRTSSEKGGLEGLGEGCGGSCERRSGRSGFRVGEKGSTPPAAAVEPPQDQAGCALRLARPQITPRAKPFQTARLERKGEEKEGIEEMGRRGKERERTGKSPSGQTACLFRSILRNPQMTGCNFLCFNLQHPPPKKTLLSHLLLPTS